MIRKKHSFNFVSKYIWLFSLVLSSTVFAQSPFELADVLTEAGESHSYIAKEKDLEVPVTVIHGAESGPVLLLTAGVHGDEFPAILALQRLREEVDAK